MQVGNIATKVLLNLIWCANEVRTGVKFLLFIINLFTTGIQHFFTGVTRNSQTLDKWLKFMIPLCDGCMLKIEFKRDIFHKNVQRFGKGLQMMTYSMGSSDSYRVCVMS